MPDVLDGNLPRIADAEIVPDLVVLLIDCVVQIVVVLLPIFHVSLW